MLDKSFDINLSSFLAHDTGVRPIGSFLGWWSTNATRVTDPVEQGRDQTKLDRKNAHDVALSSDRSIHKRQLHAPIGNVHPAHSWEGTTDGSVEDYMFEG